MYALRGVDLSIRRGEMVAIMGPSGCGKTTLLNTLSGLDDVTQGQVVVDGAPIHQMSDKKRTSYRAHRMGFIFQFFNLLPVLTGVENVELPLLVAGVKPGEARRRALQAHLGQGLQRSPWPRWAWPTRRTGARPRCRAASSSASPLRGRW